MAKLTAWLVTIIGIVLLLPVFGVDVLAAWQDMIIAIAVLAVGIGKLVRNYSKRRKK